MRDRDQRMVECTAIGYSLTIAREQLWDPLARRRTWPPGSGVRPAREAVNPAPRALIIMIRHRPRGTPATTSARRTLRVGLRRRQNGCRCGRGGACGVRHSGRCERLADRESCLEGKWQRLALEWVVDPTIERPQTGRQSLIYFGTISLRGAVGRPS